jgi:hypothetical protein
VIVGSTLALGVTSFVAASVGPGTLGTLVGAVAVVEHAVATRATTTRASIRLSNK